MGHNQCVRENLQNLFDKAFIYGDNNNLREYYRALREIELKRSFEKQNERIDVSSLAESLTVSCDILASDTGKSFVFCGNDVSHIYGNGKALTKSILNLLSNAYLHGTGNLITVKAVEMRKLIKLEIRNEGPFNSYNYGKGLSYVHSACIQSGAYFFIETDSFSTNAIILIEKAPENNCKDFYVPDFCELLNDRLSPVYVEMFGMEYH